jgi:hypothetical protein
MTRNSSTRGCNFTITLPGVTRVGRHPRPGPNHLRCSEIVMEDANRMWCQTLE